MQIVLLERIAKLGQMGDVVTVKDGYARNFLLPQGKALRANKENLARFEEQRAQLETANLDRKKDAEAVHAKLEGESVIIIRQSGDTGQLYGSVNSRDIAAAVTEAGFTVARNQIVLEKPIKMLGLHAVKIILHPEVSSMINVNVARTEEEAERQALGEDVTVEQLDEAEEMVDNTDLVEEGVSLDQGEEMAEDEDASVAASETNEEESREEAALEDSSQDSPSQDSPSEDSAEKDAN